MKLKDNKTPNSQQHIYEMAGLVQNRIIDALYDLLELYYNNKDI